MATRSTYFFYDLETSGIDARYHRIMQFAGQRTNMDLQPVGDPVNIMVRLSDDVLPSPDAILVTGITPQQTRDEGVTEAEFARLVTEEVCTPGTIMVGFNNVRFDDEFMRHTLWRTFHDPYEWSWKDGCSRWDILDVVRMTRALRPDGITWPVDAEGKATNRLELLTAVNGIDHLNAHDAMSDVHALIVVAQLLKEKQPKLYNYLLELRHKKAVQHVVHLDAPQPFVYSSGRYDSAYNKTTVAYPIAPGSKPGSVLVYDLRHDPKLFTGMSAKDIQKRLFATREERQKEDFIPIPVKELAYNRCPAIAPVGVLEQNDGWKRIQLDTQTVKAHLETLRHNEGLVAAFHEAFASRATFPKAVDVEGRLYDGFVSDTDKKLCEVVRNATERELADYLPAFQDERLAELLVRYKARNFPRSLSDNEQAAYENYRTTRLQGEIGKYMARLEQLAAREQSEGTQFLLQELQLWAESIVPIDV